MRAAIVGLGVIGKVHAEVLAEQGIELAAVCDIDPAATEGLDCARYADFDEMLERERPDVVHICTPHWLHADMIIKALKRGVNVLAEKPLCIKEEDIARILDAERASDAVLGVCLQNRYNPSTLLAREILAEKRVKYAFGSLLWHRDAAYYASGDWRGKWATEGGGVLINQAIHTLDLLILTCGDPRSVTARTSSLALRDVIEVEDTVCASFGGKVPFGLYATNTAACDMPAEIRFARLAGADAVGMSTVPEAIAASHMGMRTLGISCLTNMAAGILDQKLNHEEVLETGNRVRKDFSALVRNIIASWPQS